MSRTRALLASIKRWQDKPRLAVRGLWRKWNGRRTVTLQAGRGKGLRFRGADAGLAFSHGESELPVQEAIAGLLTEGDVLFDIGANVGFFTVIGARLVGPSGHVHAFEPVPRNARAVRTNAELNRFDNVTVHELAVSSRTEVADLILTDDAGGAALCSTGVVPPDPKGRISVSQSSIDELLAEGRLRPPNVVKIDVEGAEWDVLHGMTRTISEHAPTLVYEIDDGDRLTFERRCEEVRSFVRSLGYDVTQLPDSYPHIAWHVAHFVARPSAAAKLAQ